MITKLQADNFTAFQSIAVAFSKGVNILIGENGTGKTHLMKMMYAACCVADAKMPQTLAQKVHSVFLPDSNGRLVHRTIGRAKGSFTVYRQDGDQPERHVRLELSTLTKGDEGRVVNINQWRMSTPNNVVYIPVKDMLASAPGFISLYEKYHLPYEGVYVDILSKALVPSLKGGRSKEQATLMQQIETAIGGKVIEKDEHFYLHNAQGQLEFSLLAEGYRKLGLLFTLIQNGTLTKDSILFWDEPEANLNPKMAKCVVEILLTLQRQGVQIFLATHDYVLLKEFDMAPKQPGDEIMYHSLYKDDSGNIAHAATLSFDRISHSAIDETYDSLLDRAITRDMI